MCWLSAAARPTAAPPLLSVLGALRAGAGVVTLAAGESVIQSIAARVLEATFLPLPDESALASMAETATVCLAGCGREADETTAREMKLLLERTRGTVVLDAGGLCSLAAEKQAMRPAAGRLIVTPHPGEMARLAHTSVQQVLAAPAETALAMAKQLDAVVVLKGHRTLTATPAGRLYENRTGNAGLARRRQRRCAGRDDCRAGPRRAWPRRRQPCAAFICTPRGRPVRGAPVPAGHAAGGYSGRPLRAVS